MENGELVMALGVVIGAITMMLGQFQAYLAKLEAEGKPLPKFSLKYLVSALLSIIVAVMAILFVIAGLPEPSGAEGWLSLLLTGFVAGLAVDYVFNKPMDWLNAKSAGKANP